MSSVWKLSIDLWEQAYHTDLSILYEEFFEYNKKVECSYSEFVFYCYYHSSKLPPPANYCDE